MDHMESKLFQQQVRRKVNQLQGSNYYHQRTLTLQSICHLFKAVLIHNRQKVKRFLQRLWEHYIPSLQTFASKLLVLILCDMEPNYIWISTHNKRSYWHRVKPTNLFWLHLDIFSGCPGFFLFFCMTLTQHTWASFLSLFTIVCSSGTREVM